MKYLITLVTSLFLISACNSTKTNVSKDPLQGKWTIDSYVAFAPNLPAYQPGDVIWNFECNKSKVTVTKKDAEKHRYQPVPGTYKYTQKDGKITINGSDYNFSITAEGKLKMDSNTDPRMSKDLPVIILERM